ncbi:YkgJ family cysteine cluster protein [Geobacter sp.]|uniref:YkgJ family cysteine cluster protein n=1 Tax=Geobacter sp. TaxID=46610 RepID=UPI00263808F3|nr:YkgJ family cysteine cluster protein [Geobacter sp.]
MKQILAEYGILLSEVDDWFLRCVASVGTRIRCSEGCSECCRGLFDITLLDAAYLKQGFDRLDERTKGLVHGRCRSRLDGLRQLWPEFALPYILNYRPEEDWELLMPDDDETPCPLLGEDGACLVYPHRPMTCRLHGIPLIDLSGEVLHNEWCTHNFTGENPLGDSRLQGGHSELFSREVQLLRRFSDELLGRTFLELDIFIPTALLLDFERIDWRYFAAWLDRHLPEG